jgi:hypothetical protein
MNRQVDRVVREIEEHTARLRNQVALIGARVARDAAARSDEAARLSHFVKAVAARVAALERQAPQPARKLSAGRLSARGRNGSPTLILRVGQALMSRG